MDKADILDAIRRCAEANGGIALGRTRFEQATGIRESDWSGKFWARWNDALVEAGYEPNALQRALPEHHVLAKLAELTRDLGHFPTEPERRLRRRADPSFPTSNWARWGRTGDLAVRMVAFCDEQGDLDDVRAIWAPLVARADEADDATVDAGAVVGVVYLMRSGKHYKIGRSNAVGRRHYELTIQLPERLELVHALETDDPEGIERYWHTRFAERRLNGEWFALSKADVAAFRRRRRFM